MWPQHSFAQFHPQHGEGVAVRWEGEGSDIWRGSCLAKGGGGTIATEYWANPEIPTTFPWKVKSGLSDTRLEMERNPYYWKTDPEGRQLPFLDGVVFDIVNDPETMLLKASNGEVDFDVNPYGFCKLANKPVLARSRTEGNFDFVDVTDSRCNYVVIEFNLNHN